MLPHVNGLTNNLSNATFLSFFLNIIIPEKYFHHFFTEISHHMLFQ